MSAPAKTPPLRLVTLRDSEEVGRADPQAAIAGQLPLDELYRRFAPYVAAVATRILGRQGEVEDVVQDVFAAAARGLRYHGELAQTRSWLATVTVRTSMRKLRVRAMWRFLDLHELPHYERLADPAAGPEERQLVAEVYRALDRLPARERTAWALRYVEGESLGRVAELCGCSLTTAKRRIGSAHAAVQRHFGGGSRGS